MFSHKKFPKGKGIKGGAIENLLNYIPLIPYWSHEFVFHNRKAHATCALGLDRGGEPEKG
jgi:hypothetical protein